VALRPSGKVCGYVEGKNIASKTDCGLAAKRHLPAMYGSSEHVEAGGPISYAPDIPEVFRRAATYVDKILKGAKPSEQPTSPSRRRCCCARITSSNTEPARIRRSRCRLLAQAMVRRRRGARPALAISEDVLRPSAPLRLVARGGPAV